jgi:hypothetical protein
MDVIFFPYQEGCCVVHTSDECDTVTLIPKSPKNIQIQNNPWFFLINLFRFQYAFCLIGGSTFGLWLLFHLRDGGKWTKMTATQHGGTLRH